MNPQVKPSIDAARHGPSAQPTLDLTKDKGKHKGKGSHKEYMASHRMVQHRHEAAMVRYCDNVAQPAPNIIEQMCRQPDTAQAARPLHDLRRVSRRTLEQLCHHPKPCVSADSECTNPLGFKHQPFPAGKRYPQPLTAGLQAAGPHCGSGPPEAASSKPAASNPCPGPICQPAEPMSKACSACMTGGPSRGSCSGHLAVNHVASVLQLWCKSRTSNACSDAEYCVLGNAYASMPHESALQHRSCRSAAAMRHGSQLVLSTNLKACNLLGQNDVVVLQYPQLVCLLLLLESRLLGLPVSLRVQIQLLSSLKGKPACEI